jgi:hypothetical protein
MVGKTTPKYGQQLLESCSSKWMANFGSQSSIYILIFWESAPKTPLMVEGIWELLPHDRKDFLLFDEVQHLINWKESVPSNLVQQPHQLKGNPSGQ